MYSMLNSHMIQASHADRTQDALMAGHRRELRELRRSAPRRGKHLKRIVAATAAFVLIGGAGAADALAATSTRSDSSRRCATSHARHTLKTATIDRRFHKRA